MVIYVLCYNLQEDAETQLSQILYWLQFLNSALPHTDQASLSKWQIMIVGLRSDAKHPSTFINKQFIPAWQKRFKRLPLYKKEIFSVSSLKSVDSVQHLLEKVDEECTRIFNSHALRIPSSYRKLLAWIQNNNKLIQYQQQEEDQQTSQNYFCSIDELHTKYNSKTMTKEVMRRTLRYFHAIGHIVMINSDFVCTEPTIIPKIVANFISPDEVRIKLFLKRNIEILDEDNVKCLLNVTNSSDERYFYVFLSPLVFHSLYLLISLNFIYSVTQELSLLVTMEACYRLPEKSDKIYYLFPSLALPASNSSYLYFIIQFHNFYF